MTGIDPFQLVLWSAFIVDDDDGVDDDLDDGIL